MVEEKEVKKEKKAKTQNKTGRKNSTRVATNKRAERIAFWERSENLLRLQGWCRDGYSIEQICKLMGIATATLYTWRKMSEKIDKVMMVNREIADRMVENYLFEQCKAGNITAIIFYLKNRKRKEWQDRISHDVKQEITFDVSKVKEYSDEELRAMLNERAAEAENDTITVN